MLLTTVLSILITSLAVPLILTLVTVVFPKFVSSALLNAIEHRHNIRLAEIKEELGRETNIKLETLRSDNSTLQASIALLSANQSEIRARKLVAMEKMWNVFLQLNDKFSGVIFLDTILQPAELDEFFRGHGQTPRSSDYIKSIVSQYTREDASMNKMEESGANEIETERPFFGEQIWVIFYVLRAVYGRCALLIFKSLEKKQYQNWRDDEHLAHVMAMAVPRKIIDAAKARHLQGLQTIILHLTLAFLDEANKILSGTRSAASALPDYQAILMEERDKLTGYRAPNNE